MRTSHHTTAAARVSRTPAIVLGVGLGGFLDGIVLHQIVQWHSMGSARVPPLTMETMRQNMRWDGLFHLATWLVTLAGVVLMWRAARRGEPLPAARSMLGWMLVGWGGFNLTEGVIDHHLLALHHVRDLPAHVPLYDPVFLLGAGVLVPTLGWMLARDHAARRTTD